MVCPYCKSEQIHAEKRGFNMTTGFIGSSKIIVTCLDCGRKSKPGQKPVSEMSDKQKAVTAGVALVLIIGVLLFVRLMGG